MESTVRLPRIFSMRLTRSLISLRIAPKAGCAVVTFSSGVGSDVIRERVGQYEIAVSQTLHQCAGAQAIGAMVGEIRFAGDEEARVVDIKL